MYMISVYTYISEVNHVRLNFSKNALIYIQVYTILYTYLQSSSYCIYYMKTVNERG